MGPHIQFDESAFHIEGRRQKKRQCSDIDQNTDADLY